MPSSQEILGLLTATAHRAMGVAIAWHVLVVAAVVALAFGWRPSSQRAAQLLSLPLLSVGLVAAATGNPFNALVFTVLAVVLAVLARHAPPEPARLASLPSLVIGSAMLAVGWVYPHFLDDLHPMTYLYAAPLGVVPCATLYLVIGSALVSPLGGRAWTAILALLGLIYGVTGVVLLGVVLDVGLVAGGLALSVTLLAHPPPATLRRAARAS